ncbi:MAG: hypothetical protein ACN6PW_25790, partial [Pseudomonas kermanshahensis]|uniref:hypothetical protein n=1 Tax=Pseudomonas kermanshahensis TaxID=2745482 RepID=UPI003D0E816A
GITPASQADNEGSIPFTRSNDFKASSGTEVASGKTGDSFGDSYLICVEAPASPLLCTTRPNFRLPSGKR